MEINSPLGMYIGTHGGRLLQGIKDLFLFPIFGTIDYLGFPGQIGKEARMM